LDVPDGTSDPVLIQGFQCNDGLNQRWFLEFDDQGMCSIRSSCSLRCLDVPNGDYGANVQQYACQGSANQKWRLYPVYNADPANPFDVLFLQVRSPDEQWALYVFDDWNYPNANDKFLKLTQQEFDGNGRVTFPPKTSLRFVVHPADQFLLVVNKASGQCLDVPGFGLDDGVQIQQYDINGGDNQLWKFELNPHGRFRIRNKNSQKFLSTQEDMPIGPRMLPNSAVTARPQPSGGWC
jgi:hypothetical protein